MQAVPVGRQGKGGLGLQLSGQHLEQQILPGPQISALGLEISLQCRPVHEKVQLQQPIFQTHVDVGGRKGIGQKIGQFAFQFLLGEQEAGLGARQGLLTAVFRRGDRLPVLPLGLGPQHRQVLLGDGHQRPVGGDTGQQNGTTYQTHAHNGQIAVFLDQITHKLPSWWKICERTEKKHPEGCFFSLSKNRSTLFRWVLFDKQAPRCGAVSPAFLRKIKRVTVFLTIITQITAKTIL